MSVIDLSILKSCTLQPYKVHTLYYKFVLCSFMQQKKVLWPNKCENNEFCLFRFCAHLSHKHDRTTQILVLQLNDRSITDLTLFEIIMLVV